MDFFCSSSYTLPNVRFIVTLPLFKIARVLVRLDHVALTDLTHFRIFPRNLAPDFTHYLSERPEMSSQ
jgi:hypothetical protein